MERRSGERDRGVGQRPVETVLAQEGAAAGAAEGGAGVELQAERLAPALLVARREDESHAAVAAARRPVDVEELRRRKPNGCRRGSPGRRPPGACGTGAGRRAARCAVSGPRRGGGPPSGARETTRPAPWRERAARLSRQLRGVFRPGPGRGRRAPLPGRRPSSRRRSRGPSDRPEGEPPGPSPSSRAEPLCR